MTPVRLAAIDTNITVSSLIAPQGNEATVINMIRAQEIRRAIPEPILLEDHAVLTRPKFRFNVVRIDEILSAFARLGSIVRPDFTLALSPHEPDNRLLECAQAANADYLITGNLKHFPPTHRSTRVNAKAFLEVVEPTHL